MTTSVSTEHGDDRHPDCSCTASTPSSDHAMRTRYPTSTAAMSRSARCAPPPEAMNAAARGIDDHDAEAEGGRERTVAAPDEAADDDQDTARRKAA